MKTWVKLYTKLIDNPEFGNLPLEYLGAWTLFLTLAGRLDDRDNDEKETGKVATPERIAWYLRRPLEELQPAIDKLIQLGMIHENQGCIYITKYRRLQQRAPSARPSAVSQRVQRHRNKQKESSNDVTPSLHRNGNDAETPPDTEQIQNRTEAEAEQTAATAAVYNAWAKARGGAINPLDAEQLGDFIDEFTPEWVQAAIEEANQARQDKIVSLNYIRSILDRWKREGFKAPLDWKARREAERAQEQAEQSAASLKQELDGYYEMQEALKNAEPGRTEEV